MVKLLLIVLSIIPMFANDMNMKKCETIKLSKFTTLVSCFKIDYLIEYYEPRRDDDDNIKKITIITINDKKIIIKGSE